jgi:hypothetical protein
MQRPIERSRQCGTGAQEHVDAFLRHQPACVADDEGRMTKDGGRRIVVFCGRVGIDGARRENAWIDPELRDDRDGAAIALGAQNLHCGRVAGDGVAGAVKAGALEVLEGQWKAPDEILPGEE